MGGGRIRTEGERRAELGFGVRRLSGVQKHATEREMSIEILGVQFLGRLVLLDGGRQLRGMFERQSKKKPGPGFVRIKLRSFLESSGGFTRIRFKKSEA